MDDLQPVAERVVDDDQVLHHPLVGKRPRAARNLDIPRIELRRQHIKRGRISHFPAEHIDALPTISVNDDALLAVIHAESNGRTALVDALQAKKPRAEACPVANILGAGTDITKSFDAHE